MQVKEIMTRSAETVDSSSNLVEAARKMKKLEVGALPVKEGDELVGMITDRDITIRAVAESKDFSDTPVSEVMTPEVFYCFEDENVAEAAHMMEGKSVHRLLVMNRDYEPVGFISLSDIAVKCRDEHLTWEILEKISEPASPHR